MFKVLGVLLCGFLAGYLLRNVSMLEKLEKTISGTVLVMLFVFGLSIGMNQELVHNLGRFGGQAAVLAISGVAGSLFASLFAYRVFFVKKGGEENER